MKEFEEKSVPENRLNELPNGGRPYLLIMIQEDGSLKVSGTFSDKLIAYGLLASAKDEIYKLHEKESKIQRVNNSGGLIEMLRRRK